MIKVFRRKRLHYNHRSMLWTQEKVVKTMNFLVIHRLFILNIYFTHNLIRSTAR